MKKSIKLFKKKPEDQSLWTEPKVCKNCENIDAGKYCSNCGQSFKEINRPFRYVVEDFFSLINLDSSIFRTLIPFLFKPGFITSEYLEGKRKKYMSPVRLYLFLSIVFFFLARLAGDRIVTLNTGDEEMLSDPATINIGGDTVRTENIQSDSIVTIPELNTDSAFSATGEDSDKLGNSIRKVINDKTRYYNSLLNNISYALFLLMPVFALILQLLYIKRKRYYIEHLIFSLNMHSFALLILSTILTLQIILKGNDGFAAYLLIIIPVYFTIGMKRFYKQAIFKTLIKEILLFLIYTVLLATALVGLALFTLYRM